MEVHHVHRIPPGFGAYMKRCIVLAAVLSALCAGALFGCTQVYFKLLVSVPPDRLSFTVDGHDLSVPLVSSHPLGEEHEGAERLLVVIHGGGLTAETYHERGVRIAREAWPGDGETIVAAPQFLEDRVGHGEQGVLFWNQDWRGGALSLSEDANANLPWVSSYEVLDRLIQTVLEHNPGIQLVLVVGHSAGGQFVGRYAATNTLHARLQELGVRMGYVVANPSSYLYLSEVRYRSGPDGEAMEIPPGDLDACPGYNSYKYGLDDLYGYAAEFSPDTIRGQLLSRPVLFVLGLDDTERDSGLDDRCQGEVQGTNRLERGRFYRLHLQSHAVEAQEDIHTWLELPDVGHDASDMFAHPNFILTVREMFQ
ncbi:MAG: hypothetical protein D6E12_11720 [Desulfovibrio sp.]|nr:MAG: hypothetical protein D6E12_11720 [Desulfovibrio sp.]